MSGLTAIVAGATGLVGGECLRRLLEEPAYARVIDVTRRDLGHDREPGIAGFALLDRDLFVEIIADGVHLHPHTLRMVFSLKPSGKIVLVSDSVRGTGRSGSPPRTAQDTLAGGGAPLASACRELQKIGIPASSIRKAASSTPLKYLGL